VLGHPTFRYVSQLAGISQNTRHEQCRCRCELDVQVSRLQVQELAQIHTFADFVPCHFPHLDPIHQESTVDMVLPLINTGFQHFNLSNSPVNQFGTVSATEAYYDVQGWPVPPHRDLTYTRLTKDVACCLRPGAVIGIMPHYDTKFFADIHPWICEWHAARI
jgi:hypothetical protein